MGRPTEVAAAATAAVCGTMPTKFQIVPAQRLTGCAPVATNFRCENTVTGPEERAECLRTLLENLYSRIWP